MKKDVAQELNNKSVEPSMALNASEKKEVLEFVQKMNQAKLILAETYIQSKLLESKKEELMKTIASLDAAMAERVNGLAKSHGFDKDKDPDGWSLELTTMEFSRRQKKA